MTKQDKIGQLVEESVQSLMTGGLSDQPRHDVSTYDRPLTAKQSKAIGLLLAGCTVTEAAKRLGIRRQTLSGWINRHYSFNVALEVERRALWQRSRDELMSLASDALRVVRKHLEQDSLPAAIAIIRAVGVGERQLVMAADAARMEDLEAECQKIQTHLFKDALVSLSNERSADPTQDEVNEVMTLDSKIAT